MTLENCPKCENKLPPSYESNGKQECLFCGWSDNPKQVKTNITNSPNWLQIIQKKWRKFNNIEKFILLVGFILILVFLLFLIHTLLLSVILPLLGILTIVTIVISLILYVKFWKKKFTADSNKRTDVTEIFIGIFLGILFFVLLDFL